MQRLNPSFLRVGNFITNFSFALVVGDVPVEDLAVVLVLDAPGELLVLELQLLTDQEYLGHVAHMSGVTVTRAGGLLRRERLRATV